MLFLLNENIKSLKTSIVGSRFLKSNNNRRIEPVCLNPFKNIKKCVLTFALCLTTTMAILTSCSSGVNQKDPQNVAEAALKYYDNGDYEGLKTLVNPNNTAKIKEMDKMIELAKKFKEEYPEKASQSETVVRVFQDVLEEYTGREVTPETKLARVRFDAEKSPSSVIVEQENGMWYFERFK